MVQPVSHAKSLVHSRTSRWPLRHQHSWLRRPALLPRRQGSACGAAPHAATLSLASGVPLVIAWSHTVTSGAYHGASLWFTTLCALSVALGALSYNLMAVLAEFFHFDRRAQQVQPRTYLHGVDVTNSRFFQIPAVLAAVEFAAEAHQHQRRKTGEPYVTHCVETALIVEACLPIAHTATEQDRHVSCIMAAVLHDVIDDTPTDLGAMQQAFGPRVAALVNQVSKLSQMNQLLRRGKRQGWAQYSPDHFKQLRKLIVDLAFEEPLVILIKLADRLHNMRTVYVLAPEKQRSVAEETLEVWCSMAESLGWDGLKSEMEDLCFAVLQPSTYCTLRAELDRLWSLPTLAVVEEQLQDEVGPVPSGGGGGGGGDGLGLRIVQVSGPEAPVRHYTRAAGVRAAAAAGMSGGDDGYAARQRSRRRMGMGMPGGPQPASRAEMGPLERAQVLAAEAAVAAAAVPPPPPAAVVQPVRLSPARAAAPSKAARLAAVAASTSLVVMEADVGQRVGGGAGAAASAGSSSSSPAVSAAAVSTAAVALAVAVAVADEEEEEEMLPLQPPTSLAASFGPGDGDDPGHGSSAGASVAAVAMESSVVVMTAAAAAAAAASAASSEVAVAHPGGGTSLEVHPRVSASLRGDWTVPTTAVRHGSSSTSSDSSTSSSVCSSSSSDSEGGMSTGYGSSLHDSLRISKGASRSSSSSSTSGGAADYVGLGAASPDAFAMASYGTLESVDGPLLLDGVVLPYGMTSAGPFQSAPGGGIQQPSIDTTTTTGSGSGSDTLQPAAAAAAATLSSLAAPAPAPAPVIAAALAPGAALPSPIDPQQHHTHSPTRASQPQPQLPPPPPPSDEAEPALAAEPGASGRSSSASESGSGSGSGSGSPPAPSLPLSPLSAQQERLKLILSTVVPFESVSFKNLRGLASSTRRGLDVLDECAALLYNEIQIRSQAGGLGINIQGRLKSLHSVYRKMLRKKVAVAQVYDSRALRVIVDDGDGSCLQEAVDVCYRLVGAVHSLWKPIKREFDDYIANPKQSGYQALHTAVRGPGGIPMEVQIKTSSMHELAEYGAAAHWVYKEYTPVLQSPGRGRGGGPGAGPRLPPGYVGQPLLKVAKDKLRYGVVVSRHDDGQRLIVAVKLGATFRAFPTRVTDYGFYAGLVSYTRAKGWQVPGHGDIVLRLEEYVQCDDGRYHRRDHLGYLIPAETITLLEGFEEDAAAAAAAAAAEAEAAAAAAAAGGGGGAVAASGEGSAGGAAAGGGAVESVGGSAAAAAAAAAGGDPLRSSVDDEMLAAESSAQQRRFREQMRVTFAKTQQLRSMIAWGEGAIGKYAAADYQSDEVSVLIWPGGHIEHFARGTTAGDIVSEKGLITTGEGYDGYRVNLLINVNNRLVPEDTILNDGDLVILAREKVRI